MVGILELLSGKGNDPSALTALENIGASLQAFEDPTAIPRLQAQRSLQREKAAQQQQKQALEELGLGSPAARAQALSRAVSGVAGAAPGAEGPAAPLTDQQRLQELGRLAALNVPGAQQALQTILTGQISPEEQREFGLRERGFDLEKRRLDLSAEPQRTSLEKNLISAGLKPGSLEYREAVLSNITKPGVQITQGVGPGEFEKHLGKKRAESLSSSEEAARTALDSLDSTREARSLLEKGVITGKGASFITEFGKGLNTLGFNVAQDEIANTEAFVATRAKEVGRIIQLFGAGTGLSDADREFAQQAAAGKINMTEKSIRRILDINERASRNVIKKHNKRLERVPEGIRERLFLEEISSPLVEDKTPGLTIQEQVQSGTLPIGTQGIVPEDGEPEIEIKFLGFE